MQAGFKVSRFKDFRVSRFKSWDYKLLVEEQSEKFPD
jgi:hypothetical protein